MTTTGRESAFGWIAKNKEKIVKVSNKIWEFTELGLVEFESSALLAAN